MAITLSILDRFVNFSLLQRATKFEHNPYYYPPHLMYVAALPWET